ncbi:MAG TPA: allantoicase [Pyrinomonadaceae bacterium]|nr:allantoicase [Pyrinomonadaceae bacterium]
MDFTELIDLASEKVGGTVVFANDDFFAPKENLLKVSAPIFIEGKYTERGKWMDGWESRRRRTPGFDWCIVRLGLPGIVRGIVVDTSYFRGNYPEHCSLEGASISGQPSEDELKNDTIQWNSLLPQVELAGDSRNSFNIQYNERITHLRFKIYPDGGVARLRVYGEVVPDWDLVKRDGGIVDLASVESGALVLACSDMFFGHKHNLIMPGRASNMSDGWETKRRRGPGYDWVIIKLGRPGSVDRVEIDTSYFKGNFPESCSLEGTNTTDLVDEKLTDASVAWVNILSRTKLQAHTRHLFEKELTDAGTVSHLRFNIFPDGGVSRLRVFGRPVF